MNILITGGCGYIGSALTEYLGNENMVIKYDTINGHDILDYYDLVAMLVAYNINLVIHLAALSSVTACNEDPKEAMRVNAYGTGLILKAMKAVGCQNIIYASTSSVYGNSSDLPYNEEQIPTPCSAYGVSKLFGEEAIRYHYKENLGNYLIFRMFNVVGTSGYSKIDSKIGQGYDRLFAALESGTLTIYGNDYSTPDGTGERDYVALKDVCEAYRLGVNIIKTTKCNIRRTINISSGKLVSVQEIVTAWNKIAKEIHNKQCEGNLLPFVEYKYGPRRDGDPAQVYGSYERADKMLGWKPTRSIEDIIREIAKDKISLLRRY